MAGKVCATLLGARHVPEHLCGGLVYLGRYNKCLPLPSFLTFYHGIFRDVTLPALSKTEY